MVSALSDFGPGFHDRDATLQRSGQVGVGGIGEQKAIGLFGLFIQCPLEDLFAAEDADRLSHGLEVADGDVGRDEGAQAQAALDVVCFGERRGNGDQTLPKGPPGGLVVQDRELILGDHHVEAGISK